MKKNDEIRALRDWRQRLSPKIGDGGSMVAAGRILGISKVEYWRWETGRRRIPPEKVPYVEAITRVPREVLRPDVYCFVSKQFALEHERTHLALEQRP